MDRLLRVDLHSHTRYSPDAYTSPAELVERAAEVGLDRVAVTDHGEIEGALEARALDPGRVIVGEEIRCRCGTEFIGLYLKERIPPGLEAREVAERVFDQGGVLYAPHPYAYARRALSRAATALELAEAVEVFNARAFLPLWNRRAGRTGRRLGLPLCAGSDAHFPRELGRAYCVMPEFGSAVEFREAARASRPVLEHVTGPWMHLASAGLKVTRAFREHLPRPHLRPSLEAAEKA
jgi:predicted metal-dependent phosphoesterase TrpH